MVIKTGRILTYVGVVASYYSLYFYLPYLSDLVKVKIYKV
jgi:hypothetical protein